MSGFDWPALMVAGFAKGLRPAEIWALTPGEFALLMGREATGLPLTRDRLKQLEEAFPDAGDGGKDG